VGDPEARFSTRLHRQLPLDVHREKTANPYRRGVPDYYYEGDRGSLWAEHKWWIGIPSRPLQPEAICSSKSWPLQLRWLRRAVTNGRNAVVLIGVPSGCYLLPAPFIWDPSMPVRSLEWAAAYIQELVLF